MGIEDEIQKAVIQGATLSNLEKHIQLTPLLTSMRDGKQIAAITDFAPDPERTEDFVRFWQYEAFAYWKIRESQNGVTIAGIAWDYQQQSRMFYALVLPPR